MTITIFLLLIAICSAVSSLLTEGIKTWFKNANKDYSANLIALINAVVVGCGGTAIAYVLMGIAFTLSNILCLILMGAAVWLGSMIGYDKVIQLIAQVTSMKQPQLRKIEEEK